MRCDHSSVLPNITPALKDYVCTSKLVRLVQEIFTSFKLTNFSTYLCKIRLKERYSILIPYYIASVIFGAHFCIEDNTKKSRRMRLNYLSLRKLPGFGLIRYISCIDLKSLILSVQHKFSFFYDTRG